MTQCLSFCVSVQFLICLWAVSVDTFVDCTTESKKDISQLSTECGCGKRVQEGNGGLYMPLCYDMVSKSFISSYEQDCDCTPIPHRIE